MPASPIPIRPGASGTPGTSGASEASEASGAFPGDACPGALRLHAADDGYLARVRIPGGILDVAQARALGDAAARLGDGTLHLTSRGNVQLRGLREGCGGELAEVLGAAGLLPSAAHERVRNVVASPMSGLDGGGVVDVRGWLTGLDAALCASSVTPELSGRFLFALDDGRGDVAGLRPDVLLRGLAGGSAGLFVGGAAFVVEYADAARAAVIAAEVFVAAARGVSGRRVWRVRELNMPAPELASLIAEQLSARGIEASPLSGAGGDGAVPIGIEANPVRGAGNCATSHDAPAPAIDSATGTAAQATGLRPGPRSSIAGGAEFYGPGDQPSAEAEILGPGGQRPTEAEFYGPGGQPPAEAEFYGPGGQKITAPFGAFAQPQWAALTDLVARLPAREIRLTPWRDIVIPGATRAQADQLTGTGLVADPDSPWTRTGACTGRPGCAKANADVRADATARHPTLPTYWSGCERRCGHPVGPYVDVVARPDGTYDVSNPTSTQPS
ncbi:cobalamin biosynthesis protein CobG [Streptomyces kunmingensis]|uniref:Cobalamin biosynthesis protein CobG n=1 Tax=Streptomyces kunmingensis TaxID=68225 RepID=A0ABU6CH55_9ACTN|nr:cobalamin biosynthesis protein CobG [Streptomyces kunmingensis]MEB3963516.1 cobalamin biosynthesis protein CobG [Streptomyces kunmingensis]